MDRIAKGFTDDETQAIAAWFAPALGAGMRTRRAAATFLSGVAAAAAAALCRARRARRRRAPRVVVVGGGFAGATCARALKRSLTARSP